MTIEPAKCGRLLFCKFGNLNYLLIERQKKRTHVVANGWGDLKNKSSRLECEEIINDGGKGGLAGHVGPKE